MAERPLTQDELLNLTRLNELRATGTHYEILGILPEAGSKEVQQAYYDLSRTWHPDRFFRRDLGDHLEEIEAIFMAITEAYQVLTDDKARRSYDQVALDRSSRARARRAARDRLEPSEDSPFDRSEPSAAPRDAPPSYEARVRERVAPPARSARPAQPSAQSPAPTPARRRLSPARQRMQEEVRQRLQRARDYHQQALEDQAAGRILKAATSMHLAIQYDPRNEEYKELHARFAKEGRKVQAQHHIAAAEAAESYQRVKEAIQSWRQAVELEPDLGHPYARLALLLQKYEEGTQREALLLLRTAALKDPKSVEIRMALGDAYAGAGLSLNARREYQAVLDLDKGNSEARAALRRLH